MAHIRAIKGKVMPYGTDAGHSCAPITWRMRTAQSFHGHLYSLSPACFPSPVCSECGSSGDRHLGRYPSKVVRGHPIAVGLVVGLRLFNVMATCKIMSGRVSTYCGSAHLWRLHGAASTWSLSHQHHDTTQSHYPNTEPTSPFPILIMLSAWLGSNKC